MTKDIKKVALRQNNKKLTKHLMLDSHCDIISVQSIFAKIDKTLYGGISMWTDQALLKLSPQTAYSRNDLFEIFRSEKQDLSDGAFRWTLYNLLQEQKIFKADYDSYIAMKPQTLPVYKPYYSDKVKALLKMLEEMYPDLDFVLFESVLLNEFLNHQIAQNTIYIQIEKEVSSFIFDVLQEEYTGSVLYRPRRNEFDRYWTRDCIVVQDLISQAPLSQNVPHEITVEKMLVDIVAEKSIAATFSPSELPFVYENIIRSYQVDKRRMNRYAGRRGKAQQIKKFVGGDG